MAWLPLDPRLARVLVEAARLGCLAGMPRDRRLPQHQDPRERPADRLEAADERHATFADPRSDFATVLNLWRALGSIGRGARALRRWCRENFLSWLRMREWQDLHEQLTAIDPLGEAPHAPGTARTAALHQALLRAFSAASACATRTHAISARATRAS